MNITLHAKRRYAQHYHSFPSDSTVIRHFCSARPATEEELFLIRKTKNSGYNLKDKRGAIHYVDRDTLMVFVVVNDYDDKNRNDLNNGTLVTCYYAPYLNNTHCRTDEWTHEQKLVSATIEEAKTHRNSKWESPRWVIALYLLSQRGFEIYVQDSLRRFIVVKTYNGLEFLHKSANLKSKRPAKDFTTLHFFQTSWTGRYSWTFADFGIKQTF